jgi:hypothetical protein
VHADLHFSRTVSEVTAPADAKSVTVEFAFTNRSDKPAKIRQIDPGCSCMAVRMKGGKLQYGPGESGVLKADFEVGNFTGSVDKMISLWVDADPEEAPSVSLTVKIQIPVLVMLEPKTLHWDIGTEPKPQRIRIIMRHREPVRVLAVKSSSANFSTELRTLSEGSEYELTVTPMDVSKPGLAILSIETDCSSEKQRNQQAFAVVRKPTVTR